MEAATIGILSFVITVLSFALLFLYLRVRQENEMRKIYARQVLGAFETFKKKDLGYQQLFGIFENVLHPKDKDWMDKHMPKHERLALLKLHHRSLDAAADVIKIRENLHDGDAIEAPDKNSSDSKPGPADAWSENPLAP